MTELSRLITRLQRGISKNASYVKTIRHPHLLVISLQELNDLIGNDKVKDAVATQVSHLIMVKRRALESTNIKEDEVMLNTVLYGPPGVGKTLVGAKLAKIWYSLGYLNSSNSSNNVKIKNREMGDILKDLLGNGSNGSASEDVAITIYILLVFIILFLVMIAVGWSFYNRFGSAIFVVIGFILLFAIIAVCYIANNQGNNVKSGNNKDITNKDSKDTTNKDLPVATNEFGNSPVLGSIPSDDQIIKVVTRADFVDKYVGWSDKKTIKLLEENLGKVLFVDEAYSLVTDMHDSFGMEVLTTINLFLSQHSKEIIVIFAGYKDLMEAGLFSFQPGLRRRFMWQFDCNGYTEDQMFEIFRMQLLKKGWGLTDIEATKRLFRYNKGAFPAFGGDTERLAFFSELEHSRDFIADENGMSINNLTPDHVRRGLLKLQENNIQSNPNEESINPLANMMKMFRDQKQPTDNIINAIKNSATDRVHH